MKLALLGRFQQEHLGAHLLKSSVGLGFSVKVFDYDSAFEGFWLSRKVNWWLRGRRPTRLSAFSREVERICMEWRPDALLATGFPPLDLHSMQAIGDAGITRLVFLTDDPWNPAHYAPWFLKILPHYDYAFTPRKANLENLQALGLKPELVPFGYAPELHYPVTISSKEEQRRFGCDLAFIGGADRDRIPMIEPLISAGISVSLYGNYWDRYRSMRCSARGFVFGADLRMAISAAKVNLCLVRRGNRDGHVMRTYEIPAMGGCMLTEDTIDHRELFGKEGNATLYFRDSKELLIKVRWLLEHDLERKRLAEEAHRIITKGENTYRDRLETILLSAKLN